MAFSSVETPLQRVLSALRSLGPHYDPKKTLAGYQGRCPAHEDGKASLCLGEAEDGKALIKCQAGCEFQQILDRLSLKAVDLFPPRASGFAATYSYVDEQGVELFQVCRTHDKKFLQRHQAPSDPRAKPDGWVWSTTGVRQVVYRLPQVLAAVKDEETIWVVEGEKDAENLAKLGLVATCNSQGAGKWKPTHAEALAGARQVVIIADKDTPGRKHAQAVRASLEVEAAWVVEVPAGKDASDWISAGADRAAFEKLASEAPTWQAPAESPAIATRAGIILPIPKPDRVEIRGTTDEAQANKTAIKALGGHEAVYQRGGMLVCLQREPMPPPALQGKRKVKVVRHAGTPSISSLAKSVLRSHLTEQVNFVGWNKKTQEWDPAHPWDWLVNAVYDYRDWPEVRILDSIVESPILRPDGTVAIARGYDLATCTLYEPNCAIPSLIPNPTLADAQAAIAELLEVVCDFPFATEADRSAWLSALMTPFCRLACGSPTPLFAIDGNIRGAGKGKLLDTIAWIFSGRRMPTKAYNPDDDEMRKSITSAVISGNPMVLIDNIDGVFGGAAIDTALTAMVWHDRLLGHNREIIARQVATYFATGNNLFFKGDLARRTMRIRLESAEADPEKRDGFKHPDLEAYVIDNRPRLIRAVLTILTAYVEADSPDQKLPAWGSFEGWSDLVRGSLVWAGRVDPGETRDEMKKAVDTEGNSLVALIDGWEQVALGAGIHAMTAAKALEVLATNPKQYDKLRNTVLEMLPPKYGNEMPNSQSFGMLLRKYLKRPIPDGRCFHAREKDGTNEWRVGQFHE